MGPSVDAKSTKGAQTAERILDVAEGLFAERGYEGATLREIARRAQIQQPGIYNHFEGKRALYAAVLDRALTPMRVAMQESMANVNPNEAYAALPGVMTDHLLAHPQMAALFHQALHGNPESIGGQMMGEWLERLFSQGMATLDAMGASDLDRRDRAIRIIAMFNLTTGYFLSQRAFSSLVSAHRSGAEPTPQDRVTDPENIRRQKRLLARIAHAALGA